MKWDKMSYNIYSNIESLIKKIDNCKSNLENFATTKTRKHIPCGCSLTMTEKFLSIFKHMKNIIDFEKKKKNVAADKKELKSYQDENVPFTEKSHKKVSER